MGFRGLTAVTVFCADGDPETVTKQLTALGVATDLPADWATVETSGQHGAMTITRRMFEPDSTFSRTVLAAHNTVRLAGERRAGAQADALALLEACDMLLRVRFAPSLSSGKDERIVAVQSLAQASGGVVFDGRVLTDESGATLLTATKLVG